MAKDSDRRKRKIFHGALPIDDDYAMSKIRLNNSLQSKNNIKQRLLFKKKQEEALKYAQCQIHSSSGSINEEELRHYLKEFNIRAWKNGLLSMPAMFNSMEAFFEYNRDLIYFELLEEENYHSSLGDFLVQFEEADYFDTVDLNESILDDLIHNYPFVYDENPISISTSDSKEFFIGNAAIVKRGQEVTVMIGAGQVVTEEEKSEIVERKKQLKKAPQPSAYNKRKRGIGYDEDRDEDRDIEVVIFLGDPGLWYTVAAVRFDLESNNTDIRYLARDVGQTYEILTDDIKSFTDSKGNWINEYAPTLYESSFNDIVDAESLFELAKKIMYLPYYVKKNEGRIKDTVVKSKLSEIIPGPIAKRKFKGVPSKYMQNAITIYHIEPKGVELDVKSIAVRDDKFTVEKSGKWKTLNEDEYGADKEGNQIKGKTWVNTTELYFKASSSDIIIKSERKFNNKGSGYVYIMRQPTMDEGIFKIGLTRREVEKRRKEFSGTNTLDAFHIMFKCETKDCVKAEKAVHNILRDYRLRDDKEFFEVSLEKAVEIVKSECEKINE